MSDATEYLLKTMINDQNRDKINAGYCFRESQPIRPYLGTTIIFSRPLGIAYVNAISGSTCSYFVQARNYQNQFTIAQPPVINNVTSTINFQREALFAEVSRLRETMYWRDLIYN